MFSLQEYQHVHLLWFKKRSFTLVWKPNPPLRSVRCAHLCARADTASESTMGALCIRAASALALLTRAVWNGRKTRLYWSARAESASIHVISEIFLLLQCAALEQRRPCTRTSVTTSNFYSHTLKKWSQSRALWIARYLLVIFFFFLPVYDKNDSPLTSEEEEQRGIAKIKMLGNIKFIGELGKLDLIHESILHKCIKTVSYS